MVLDDRVIPPSLELKKPAVIKYLEPVLMPSLVVLHLVCRKKLLLLLDLFEGVYLLPASWRPPRVKIMSTHLVSLEMRCWNRLDRLLDQHRDLIGRVLSPRPPG